MVCDCGEYDENALMCSSCGAGVCLACQVEFFDGLYEAEVDETIRLYVVCRSCITTEWNPDAGHGDSPGLDQETLDDDG